MSDFRTAHLAHWPVGLPHHLEGIETSIPAAIARAGARNPSAIALRYQGRSYDYGTVLDQITRLAAALQEAGLRKGDRVLLYMQNSPQFIIGYHGVLWAGGVVVPVNPMSRGAEIEHYVADSGARLMIAGAEVYKNALGRGLETIIVAAYADMGDPGHDLPLPAPLAGMTDAEISGPGLIRWRAAMAADPLPLQDLGPDDLSVIPYSSGTTGQPKGCVHTHRSVMTTALGGAIWNPSAPGTVHLVTLPLFHVTGMQAGMNGPLLTGAEMIILTRWDRMQALELIRRHGVHRWRAITAMLIDLLAIPELTKDDLSTLRGIGGGGAAMPAGVAKRLLDLTGLSYVEGYGMSETMAATHINPPQEARPQCLGIPVFDVDARILSLEDDRELGPGEAGEIIMHGPQVFQGYWNNPEATDAVFITLDGKRFIRSGDIGMRDADGYFYMVDRVKRMVNAAGFKVWPAEVEALMHHHPGIRAACVIGVPDARRGETVKAFVERSDESLTEEAVIAWCHEEMSAYKCPRAVEFVESLPRSGTGKVDWRTLTEAARAAAS